MTKVCLKCDKEKNIEDFSKDRPECKECRNNSENIRRHKDINKYNSYKRDYKRYNKYNITNEQYEELKTKQNNSCAICFIPASEVRYGNLCIDHNHQTDEVRGLLCPTCNRALGLFKDNEIILKRAIGYLNG